jgi:hypothetical protein
MRSPLCSSATPPASVTAAEIANTIAVRFVDGAAALFFAFECFIGDETALEHEHERRGPVCQRADHTQPDGIEDDEDDGLDRDAAEDVPDRDADVVRERCAHGDRDLGQVRCQREDHEPADRFAEAEPVVEHVGCVRQVDACDPDGAGRADEYEHEKRERHAAVAFAV